MVQEESKEQRFKRIAEARTQKILNMLDLLGNCSNRNNYDYSEDDVKKIIKAIEEELNKVKTKFDLNSQKNKTFKL